MAIILHCRVCREMTHDGSLVCPRCRSAELEDLLGRIKEFFLEGQNSKLLPEELSSAVLVGQFGTMDGYLKKLQERRDLETRESLRETQRALAVSEAADIAGRKFDKKHPPFITKTC